MTSPSTDSPQDQAELQQRAATSASDDSTPDPTASAPAAAESGDAGETRERKKIKIGSQREGAPKIRMQKRTFSDSSLSPPTAPSAQSPASAPASESAAPTNVPAASPPVAADKPGEAAAGEAASAPVAPESTAEAAQAPPSPPPADVASVDVAPAASPSADSASPTASPPPREQKKPPRAAPVEVPRLTDDLDSEVEAALGGMSLDEIIAQEDKPQTGEELEPETRRRGIVLRVDREDVFLSVGVRHEAVTPLKHFSKPPEPGDQLDVIITRFNSDEGLYEVTVPGAAADVGDWSDVAEGTVVEARVTGSNTGGLECQVNHIRGFIPASQISLYRVENFGEYVGQKLLCVITEANPERKNLVLSHRAVLEREKEQAREGLLAQLEVGQVHEGTVRSLRDFGAFVDIGGVDGLVHISKLSWDRVEHPKDVLHEGQKVKVKIEKIDRQSGKIGLSYRDLLEDPWENVEQKYPVGSIQEGEVSRIAQFGAFVKLEPGVEGLVHVSELAHHRVANVGSYVKQGQTVQVKVVSVDRAAQRIGLSMKALVQVADTGSKKTEEAEDEAPREMAVPKRKGPLKGGLGRSSGGEQFGLNW